MPRVSVIMPVYNTDKEYFKEAIDSILAQTFDDFELIIIDNGSADYIAKFLSSYKDKRIKIFRSDKNQGPANARNYGIEKAKGEFIALMDSDDISLPERLAKQVEFFDQNPDIGCLGTSVKTFGNDAKSVSFPTIKEHLAIECHLILSRCVFCHSSVMLRKSILDNHHLRYNPEYVPAEDYNLWLSLIGNTKFAVLEDVLVYYRFYHENTSHAQLDIQQEKAISAQYRAFKKQCNIPSLSKQLWIKFIAGKPLSCEENKELAHHLTSIIDTLVAKGYPQKDIFCILKKRFKKLYYRTHTLKGQWALMRSPVNQLFNIKPGWRIFYLITRGVF